MKSHPKKTTQFTVINFWFVLVALGVAVGCQSTGVPPGNDNGPPNGIVSYAADVEPILTTLCATCHREGGIADRAGVELRLTADEAFDMLLDNSVMDPSLVFVVPGDADSSLLFLKINSDNPPVGERMPFLNAPLDADQIALIRDWINQGALDN